MSKNKYYKKKKHKNVDIIGDFIALLFLFSIITTFYLYKNPYLINNIIIFIIILFLIVIFYFILKFFFNLNRKNINNKLKTERNLLLPQIIFQIKEKIETFKPLKQYSKEEPYQIELSGYLKNFFPSLDIEVSKNYTRPDIIIENIAIEIKGPTNFNDLKTIPDKIIRYTKEWDYLIIVLFNIKLHDDIKKSTEIYESWKKDIEENFSHKMNKMIFIEI